MGKTEKGAIWLNKDLFSPYDYWQFWRNTDDRDVKKFLNFFTDIEPLEINKLEESEKNINNLKILLANEATKVLHGEKAAKNSEKTAIETFNNKGFGKSLPEIQVKFNIIDKGLDLLEFLANNKIISSKSEARRLILNKGLKINNAPVDDDKKVIRFSDFEKKILKISLGKKKHYLIKII